MISDGAQVRELYDRAGVIVQGHFVCTGGLHSGHYFLKDKLYMDPTRLLALGGILAEAFLLDNIEVVIASAVAGVALSQWVTYQLKAHGVGGVQAMYADKEGKDLVIKRGYEKYIKGKRVLIVEDVMHTGGTTRGLIHSVRSLGGRVVGVGVLCNRGSNNIAELNVRKFVSLYNASWQSWSRRTCPLCKEKVPVNISIGHGKRYMQRKHRSKRRSG